MHVMGSSVIDAVHNNRRALRVLDAFEKILKSNFIKRQLRDNFIAGTPCANCAWCLAAAASSPNEFKPDLEEVERCFNHCDVDDLRVKPDDLPAFEIQRIPVLDNDNKLSFTSMRIASWRYLCSKGS